MDPFPGTLCSAVFPTLVSGNHRTSVGGIPSGAKLPSCSLNPLNSSSLKVSVRHVQFIKSYKADKSENFGGRGGQHFHLVMWVPNSTASMDTSNSQLSIYNSSSFKLVLLHKFLNQPCAVSVAPDGFTGNLTSVLSGPLSSSLRTSHR